MLAAPAAREESSADMEAHQATTAAQTTRPPRLASTRAIWTICLVELVWMGLIGYAAYRYAL